MSQLDSKAPVVQTPLDRESIFRDMDIPAQLQWIQYVKTDISYYTTTDETHVAYGYVDNSGCANIVINKTIWDKSNDTQKAHVIAHELGHFMYNHYGFVENVIKPEILEGKAHSPQLLNIVGDCGIHTHLADDKVVTSAIQLLQPEGNAATYQSYKFPVLPPIILYRFLQPKLDEVAKQALDGCGCGFAEGQLQHGSKDMSCDGDIIAGNMLDDLKDALKDNPNGELAKEIGKAIDSIESNQKNAGTQHGGGREMPAVMPTKYPWVVTMLRYLKKSLSQHRKPSYRRESKRQDYPSDSEILLKGRSRVYDKTECILCVDVSGSMSRGEVNQALSGMAMMCMNYGVKGSLIFFDAKASPKFNIHQGMDIDKIIEASTLFGGGTEFNCVMPHLKPTDHVVIYTDTYLYNSVSFSDFNPKPIVVTTTGHPEKQYFKGVTNYIYTGNGELI